MRCATGHAATEAGELSGLDARLLVLDADLEELFAEIDQVLREARDRWRSPPPRGPRAPWPRPGARRPGGRTARLHGRRPGVGPARQRGPPPALRASVRYPMTSESEVMPVEDNEDHTKPFSRRSVFAIYGPAAGPGSCTPAPGRQDTPSGACTATVVAQQAGTACRPAVTATWTTTPAGSDFDRAGQNVPLRDSDLDIGLDTTTLPPLAEALRAAIEPADLTDRIDQAWITPHDDDDYDYLAR
ncbi:hypothetical protein OHB12_16990 [Nocardia sp. NBC_01730]|uniref:hypothetical protein n=1 Tax=Nocardia sp. NBC_01730 TaxID=2975998 RepID=UPI002E0E900E|nr:hypothetical protein OHB12_16990 [Nocardia sp. NBC_01730]